MSELVDHGFLLLVAGSETTAYTLSCITYYLLTHEECLRRVKEELQNVPQTENGVLKCNDTSELPYLVSSALFVECYDKIE